MRDHQHRATAVQQAGQQPGLGVPVRSTGGLVEDQQLWLAGQRPGDRQTLLLASGELGKLSQRRGQATRQCPGQAPVADLVTLVSDEYAVTAEACEGDIVAFLDELVGKRLVSVS